MVKAFLPIPGHRPSRTLLAAKKTHKVTVQHEGTETVLEVREDVSILAAALEAGVELPHDCELGVCLTCPSRIVSGDVDQTGGTLDDSVMQQVCDSQLSVPVSCLLWMPRGSLSPAAPTPGPTSSSEA